MRFDRQIATAQKLIKKNGMDVIWRQPFRGTVQDQPWKQQENPPEEFDVRICFLPLNRVGKETSTGDGVDIQGGSEQGLLYAVPFEPLYQDVCIRGEETLRVVNIKKLAPNGQAILYTIEFAL